MTPIANSKRILEDVLPLRIIREVEKWPIIYKRDNPEMGNPHFKYKVWEEVAKNIFENYQIYSTAEKQAKVTGLIKKWRNLRDTFKRQLMVEKKNREGHNIKRKEYVYFKHMAFLLPHMGEPDTTDEPATAKRARVRRRAQPSCEPSPSVLAAEDIDEDKHFLLSLLPSFKRMTDDEKLTAKMEILKVIKDVKNNAMALEFVVDDSLAGPGGGDDDVVVKSELLTVEVSDYRSGSDSTGDTE